MADFDSTSYVQRRNLDVFPAKCYPALKFFFKIDILLQNFWAKSVSCFRILGQKVYPGKHVNFTTSYVASDVTLNPNALE